MAWSQIWPLYWPVYLAGFTRFSGDVIWFSNLTKGVMWFAFANVVKAGIWFGVWLLYCVSSLGAIISHVPSDVTVDVTTQRYDNARTGANLSETILNTSNVSTARFGKLFTRAVDDDVYAQPLYLHQVILPNALIEGLRLPVEFKHVVSEALTARRLGRVHRATLVTFNPDDFSDVPGLSSLLWPLK